jgi:hypothetical protein
VASGLKTLRTSGQNHGNRTLMVVKIRLKAAKGVGEVGDGPEPRTCRCLTPVLVCIGIAFSPYIVAVVCRIEVIPLHAMEAHGVRGGIAPTHT